MIVVATNILAYLCLPGEFSQLAEVAYHKDPHWIAPMLWHTYEQLNGLENGKSKNGLCIGFNASS